MRFVLLMLLSLAGPLADQVSAQSPAHYPRSANRYHRSARVARGSIHYYTNSRGNRIQAPTLYSVPPANATAECRDGSYSYSQSRRGTCSRHGGVKQWF
ncbi:hypothetical protein GCM10027578_42490 [Spirosoma luteolum]